MTIGEKLKTAQDGFPCEPFECTITKVWPAKSGQGQFGPWTMQGADTECGGRLSFNSMDDMSHLAGATIRISCQKTSKGSLAGAKFSVRTNNGKEYRQVTVSKMARIEILSGGSQPQLPMGSAQPKAQSVDMEAIKAFIRDEVTRQVSEAMKKANEQPDFDQDGLNF